MVGRVEIYKLGSFSDYLQTYPTLMFSYLFCLIVPFHKVNGVFWQELESC